MTYASHPSGRFVVAAAALLIVVTAWALAAAEPKVTHAQTTELSIPDVHFAASGGGGDLHHLGHRLEGTSRVAGQEGFGDSWLELQSGAEDALEATITFRSKQDGRRVTHGRRVDAGVSTVFPMAMVPGLSPGNWSAHVQALRPIGAVVRTRWPSGAATGARAARASRVLILPLLVVDAYGHSSIVTLMNGSAGSAAQATIKVFENDTGGPLVAVGAMLEPLAATSWDTAFERVHFGPSTLPRGASGGYVGALWVEASTPVSLMSYGDEGSASGSSAIVARPQESARREQHLPLLLGGPGGGSLVGVANATSERNAVEVRFYDTDGSLVATQRFELAPRGAAALDLAGRDRGTVSIAGLPDGFRGSAMLAADRPILAAAHNETMVDGEVDTIAGYNGFSNDDLGTTVAVAGVRRTTDFVTSALVVHNPHTEGATVTVGLHEGVSPIVTRRLNVPARGTSVLDLRDVEAFPSGLARARIDSDRPVAVLVRDTRDASVAYPIDPIAIDLREHDQSEVEGKARIMETEDGFRVWIQMDPTVTQVYQAAIHEGTCLDRAGAKVHDLLPVAGGRATTTDIRSDLRAVADGAHAIRLAEIDDRRVELQSCGIIPWVRGVEVADEMLAEGIVLANENAPTATPKPVPPTATSEPTQARPTQKPVSGGRSTAYLPRAIR